LEAAQAIYCEVHPMGSTQGQTAIFESKDGVSAGLITAESMRSEANPKIGVGST
jgi:hypothetical protein